MSRCTPIFDKPHTLRRRILTTLLALLNVGLVIGQGSKTTHAVKVMAHPKPDSILLRWAPSDKEAWKQGNKYGYVVERTTLVENKLRLAKTKRVILTAQPLKPLPLADWEPVAKSSKYGAIAAQALYGEDFKTNATSQEEISGQGFYQKAMEQDMRFGFALFAADMDVHTAKASGLRYVDAKVKKGDKYLYRVYIATPALPGGSASPPKEGNFKIDTALVYTGTDEYAPLPKPVELSTVFLDSVAVLSWNSKVQENVYVAYEVERSADNGLSFQARTKEPFVPILKNSKNPFSFYKDSTPANTALQYRIRGLNAFGEKGPYSSITKGTSQSSVLQAPKELHFEVLETRKVKLSWTYGMHQMNSIQGFRVYRSADHEKGYKVVSGAAPIAKTQFSFVDAQPLGAGYYQVMAVDLNGQEHSSFPLMVQFEDAEPPLAPSGLKGLIDRQGKVAITWAANSEKDLLGYYVYVSNSRNDEFSRLTPDPIMAAAFTHKVSLRTLTDSVYYQVLALDKRYNESKRTLLALARPDIIPPAPIALIETIGTEAGIQIVWHNSPSKDAQRYLLSRKEGQHDLEGAPKYIESFASMPHKGDTTTFLDSTAQAGMVYQYGITVVDKSGLKSETSVQTLEVRRKKQALSAKALNFTGAWVGTKIVLNWKTTGSSVKHWIIYRSSQGERLAQYEAAVGETFTDIKVEPLKTYQYMLRPVFNDRTLGALSETLKVQRLE